MTFLKGRPVSPHLQIYKWQITSVLSILHRFTGIGFCIGLLGFVVWLYFLTQGADVYLAAINLMRTPLGQTLIWGFVFCANFHFGNGIRHLIWDTGHGFSTSHVNFSGWFVVCFVFFSTLFLFLTWR